MFEELPRTFETAITRDLWLWLHENAPLLTSQDKEDRLLSFPDYDAKYPSGEKWAAYGNTIAVALEKQQRWAEAQAYWFASAHLLAQDGKTSSDNFVKSIVGIVRAGGCSAGMIFEGNEEHLEDFMETGLHCSLPVQAALTRSLIIIGTLQPSIYENVTSSQTRKIYAQELNKMFPYIKRDSQQQKLRGSHEVFSEILRIYPQDISQIRSIIDGMIISPTLDYVRKQRENLLRILGRFQHVMFEYDKLIHARVCNLITSKFTNYLKFSEEINEDIFVDFMQDVHSILEEVREQGSHLATCIYAPLVLCLGATVNAHYQGNVASKLPELKIQLLKPIACHIDDTALLEIEIINDGTGVAYDCELHLQPEEVIDTFFEKTNVWFGRVEPNYPKAQQCKMKNASDISVTNVEFMLEWRDRRGLQTRNGFLKIIRQQTLDWDLLELLEAPYTIQSITVPEKLKGRDEKIRTLRLGFQGKSSFMITGQKRVGKTSLVQVFLAQLALSNSILPLYIPIGELSAASYDDLGQLGWELAQRVIEGYKIKFGEYPNINVPDVEMFRNSFNSIFPQFIREFLRMHPIRLAFAIDDFDELSTQLFTGPVGKSFFLTLRALINDGISFFFIGSERLPAIMFEQAERLNQVRPLKVDYLSHDALVALACEPVKNWLEYTNDAILEIEVWSARNPYFATLICNAIWERALNLRDCWITKRDVEYAVQDLAKTSNRNSYQHFWSDSPLTHEEERSLYITKSICIILALYKHQPGPLAFAEKQTVIKNCEGLKEIEAEQHLQELINCEVVETHRENNNFIRLRVPIFTVWLQGEGAHELRRSEITRERLNTIMQRSNDLSSDEILNAAENLSYRGEKITSDQVRAWVSQFGPVHDQRLMLKLLYGLKKDGLFTEPKFRYALQRLHELVRQEAANHHIALQMGHRNAITNWYVTHADPTGKSGSSTAKQYRSLNNIPASQCGDPDKVLSAILNSRHQRSVLICVDDFVGTGFSAAKDLRNLISKLDTNIEDWRDRILLVYATIISFEDGLRFLEEQINAEAVIIPFKYLSSSNKAFHEDNQIFDDVDERIQARDIALKIGKVLEKRHPLGWEDSQALVVFPDNVPNNSLPIFYKDGVEYNGKIWKALFPRS